MTIADDEPEAHDDALLSRPRTEAFSDAVFAIALTLLVLDLRPPTDGRYPEELLADWPAYLAYLVAFLTIASIWLNHHAVFARLRAVDAPTLVLNLGLLLGTALTPWPTALISASIRSGIRADQTAAVVVYALLTVLVAVPWGVLNRRLARTPSLLRRPDQAVWLRRNSRIAVGSVGLAAIGAALALVSPLAALLLFLAAPLASLVVNLRSASRRGGERVGGPQ